jgi:magnesium chelatase subunit D
LLKLFWRLALWPLSGCHSEFRRALRRGHRGLQQVQLVVVTDGRGNVPLEASRIGRVARPVGREGVDDALAVARQIRSLRRVQAVLLDPQPPQHAELPTLLADALGATVVTIPLLEAAQV